MSYFIKDIEDNLFMRKTLCKYSRKLTPHNDKDQNTLRLQADRLGYRS